MEKPDEQSEREISRDTIRAERKRRREMDPGYKAGKEIGQNLKRGSMIMLPIQMALAPVGLTLGGYYLDKYAGSFPWFTIGGLVFGLTVAVRVVIHSIKEAQE